jgi:segregation and condensation protein B
MLNSGDDPYGCDPPGEADAESGALAPPQDALDDDLCPTSPATILEAMLFVGSPSSAPLSATQVAGLMRGVRPAEIDALVRQLNQDYARRRCPYKIVHEGAGYRLKLRDEFSRAREQFYGKSRAARLSQAAIEVLAIVAYNAPVTTEDVGRLRGKPSGHVLLQLVRRQLLRVERDATLPRRVRYSTTPRFLQLFGLESLDELPQSQDLEQG